MLEREAIIPLPEDVFRLLRDLIRDYCGIYFDESSMHIIERRLSKRIKEWHLDNFRDYYRFLLYDKNRETEFAALMDILTVNETYFFREEGQLKAFSDEIIKEVRALKHNNRSLRIWSAGCSSGEEAYTVAMLLLERGELKDWNIEVIGSDINQRVLQTARKGIYRKNSFRNTDEYFMKKYFIEEDGHYRVKDVVRELVYFSHMNLIDPIKVQFIGTIDVVFCRNVLIYFDLEARRKVIDNFFQRLADGGYLLLGHAESLMNISTAFTLKHLKNDMVYQKPRKASLSVSDENLLNMVWGSNRR